MEIRIENQDNGSRMMLSGEMTIYSAARLQGQLMDLIRQCKSLEIDLADVSDLDSAGLQLLALAKRDAGASDKPIHFRNHSPAVLEVLDLCDLGEMFDVFPAVQ